MKKIILLLGLILLISLTACSNPPREDVKLSESEKTFLLDYMQSSSINCIEKEGYTIDNYQEVSKETSDKIELCFNKELIKLSNKQFLESNYPDLDAQKISEYMALKCPSEQNCVDDMFELPKNLKGGASVTIPVGYWNDRSYSIVISNGGGGSYIGIRIRW